MFRYNLWLAAISLKRNPVLTALMIAAIGLGIGMAMTSYTVLSTMSGNPLAYKNDLVRRVQLDNWGAEQPYNEPNEPPELMSYRDVTNLLEKSDVQYRAASYPNFLPIEPAQRELQPYMLNVLFATGDFFPVFEPPFRFGNGWGKAEDANATRVVVLGHETNEKVFGGANSVGKKVRLGGEDYTVVGVLHEWDPKPKPYHVSNGAFGGVEHVFVPFKIGIEKELTSSSNNSCWESPADDDDSSGYAAWLASDCVWLDFTVQVKNADQVAEYRRFLDNYVTEEKKAGRFPRKLNNRLYSISEWFEAQNVVSRDARTQVWLAFAFLLVCLINTVGLLLAKFMGKSPEIGLRRAVGASKPQVFAQFLTESAVVGVAGGMLGLGLSLLGLLALRTLYAGTSNERLANMDWSLVAVTMAVALVASLLAGLYPTWRACQVQPATQLKTQ